MTNRAHPRQRPIQARGVALFQVVQVQHLGVQIQVQLAAQKTAQVFVDEIIETVLGRVALDVFGQQRALIVGLGRRRRAQQGLPVRRRVRVQDVLDRLLVDPALLPAAVARPYLLFAFRQRAMLEAHDQIVAEDGDGAPASGEHKAALLAGGFLDVVLLVVRRRNLETHAPQPTARADREHVGGVVLGRLDVILVGVGPVQFYFLAVVGDQIGRAPAAGIATLRHEVALGVITGKEVGEMVIDVGFGVRVFPHRGQARPQFLDMRRFFGFELQFYGIFLGVLNLFLQIGTLAVAGEFQPVLYLRQQILVEKRRDLGRLHAHDPIQAEVQIAALELEHLAQQRFQAVEFFTGTRGRSGTVGHRGGSGVGHGQIIMEIAYLACHRQSLKFRCRE